MIRFGRRHSSTNHRWIRTFTNALGTNTVSSYRRGRITKTGRSIFTTELLLSSSSVASSSVTNPHRRFFPNHQRRCDYHELSYETNGKPGSCINYYQSSNNNKSDNIIIQSDHISLDILKRTDWVLVEMIAAPYNPADALSIQGIYANPYSGNDFGNGRTQQDNPYEQLAQMSRRSALLPWNDGSGSTVPGSEGWGRIIDIQSSISGRTHENSNTKTDDTVQQQEELNIGDFVVLGQPGLGTYRSSMWLPSTSVVKLQRGPELFDLYGPTLPAPLFQTAGTALRMLRDYLTIASPPPLPQPTDDSVPITIVQNAGNSAVGLMVSQIATKIMNLQCISIIRSSHRTKEEMDELQQYMMEYGNPTQIVAEESILKPDDSFIYPFYDTSYIRLGLNAVGGDSIHALMHMMTSNPDSGTGATIVTYGNMSKQPVLTIDPSHLIFRNLNFTGFWYSRWMVQQQYQQYLNSSICVIDNSSTTKQLDLRSLMMNEIVDAVLQGSVKCPPVQAFPLCDCKSAFEQSRQQITIKPKIVFDCRE